MKWAAWSELPRATVKMALGLRSRRKVPKSLYSLSLWANWRAMAAGPSRASCNICVFNRTPFNQDTHQFQIAIQQHRVTPSTHSQTAPINDAEIEIGRASCRERV